MEAQFTFAPTTRTVYTFYLVRRVSAATGIITTVAGGGTATFTAGSPCPGTPAATATDTVGDGCPAHNANTPADSSALSAPAGVALDAAGNLYISDTGNHRVRRVSVTTGIITTVAGNGTAGTTGDGGLAINAEVAYPIAGVDAAGNLYISENRNITATNNNLIRKVTAATGIITTLAGGGTVTFTAGSPCPGTSADIATDSVGDGCPAYNAATPADSAELNDPEQVVVDAAGNLYFSDLANQRVRKIIAATGIITSVVGNGTGAGNGQFGAFGGDGGAATLAELNDPSGIAIDPLGNLYIADQLNGRVRKVDPASSALTFLDAPVGGTSPDSPQTATVSNNGTADLTFSLPGSVGAFNPSLTEDFSYSNSSSCLQTASSSNTAYTLNAGESCTAMIDFTPVIAGSISGSLATIDNNLNVSPSTQSISLTGTATAATGTTSQTITFPQPASPVVYGASPITLTATSSSGLAVFYTVTGPATVSGSVLTFTSGVGTVVVTANQNGNGMYAAATAVSNSIMEMAPGTDVDSTSATLTVTVTITTAGTTNATLGTAIQALTQGFPGLDFAYISGGTCAANTAYTVGQTCMVEFSFTPTAPGLRLGAVVLADNASPAAPLGTAYISGIGYGPLIGFTPGTISTIAGNGTAGSTGDNGTATAAELSRPAAIALDGAGNLYIADQINNRIREVTVATGIITTVAGNGTSCSTSATTGCMDGGAATNAELDAPQGVAVDGAGNLYIADTSAERIRMVTAATRIITTVAGNGTAAYSGDGGAATAAELSKPDGIAVDEAGNLYIADASNGRVREVTAATGVIFTVAGGGTATFSVGSACPGTPSATATDTVGDGCPAINATTADSVKLDAPQDITVDGSGNLYIADTSDQLVREVTSATGIISAVAGNGAFGYAASQDGGAATSTELYLPKDVAVDGAGNLYIADYENQRIRKVTVATGIISTVVGNGTAGYLASQDGGAATSAELHLPTGVVVDGAGNLYIADETNQRIRKVTAAANPIAFPASTPVGTTDTVDGATTLTVTNNGNGELTFPAPSMGTNPSISADFTLGSSSTCPQLNMSSSAGTLASGTSCTDLISFAPVLAGSISGSLVLTDNSTVAQQTVDLTGTATQQTLTLMLAPVTTVTYPNSSALSVSLTWTGSASAPTGAVTFSVDSGSALSAACTGTTSPITCTYSGSFAAGSHTLNASDAADTNYSSASATAGSFTVLAATAKLVFGTSPATPLTAGGNGGSAITVLEENSSSALVTTATDPITLAVTGPTGFTTRIYGPTAAIAGIASFNVSAAALTVPGTYTYTATFGSLTNAVASETVNPALDFSFTLIGTANPTVVPGSSVNLDFLLSPTYGVYPGPVTFTVSGLPPGATYTISTAQVASTAGPQTIAFTIQTQSTLVQNTKPSLGRRFAQISLAFLLLPLCGIRKLRRRIPKALALSLIVVAGALGASTLAGCGAGAGYFTQANHSYPVTITAISGTVQHSSVITLDVQ